MQYIAISKSVKISPRKVRLIADSIRNLSLEKALDVLSLERKRPASVLFKTLKSAKANALNNGKANEEKLYIKSLEVSEGSAFKRFRPSTRGRVHPYKKRTSNIKIVLEEEKKNG